MLEIELMISDQFLHLQQVGLFSELS